MKTAILNFLRDEEGATAIEYGIIAGMMAVVLAAVFTPGGGIGTALTNIFTRITSALNGTAV